MKKIALGSTVLRSAPIAFGCMRMAGLEVEKMCIRDSSRSRRAM